MYDFSEKYVACLIISLYFCSRQLYYLFIKTKLMANEEINNKPAEQEDLEIKPVDQEIKEEDLKEVSGGCFMDYNPSNIMPPFTCQVDVDPRKY